MGKLASEDVTSSDRLSLFCGYDLQKNAVKNESRDELRPQVSGFNIYL